MKAQRSGFARSLMATLVLCLAGGLLSAQQYSDTPYPDSSGITTGIGQSLVRVTTTTTTTTTSTTTTTTVPVAPTLSVNTGPDPVLVALGSLGASNLYYSYLTLGTVADGFVSGTYNSSVAVSVANEAIFMNANARDSLQKLVNSSTIAKEDRDVVASMISTYDILNNQAKALIQFVSNKSDDGSMYQKYRTDAWQRIVDLFGIKR